MTYYQRHYRVVAADTYREPTGRNIVAKDGHHRTETAERDLRRRLAAGERPPVLLAAPERGTLETGRTGARIYDPVFAWEQDSDWQHTWMHAPHAVAILEPLGGEERDQISEPFAQHGSVRLYGSRVAELHLSSWLAPVADQLHDMLGVNVVVSEAPDIPMPEVPVADVLVLPGLFTPEVCDGLWAYYCEQDYNNAPSAVPTSGPAVTPPPELWHLGLALLQKVGAHFGLPVTDADIGLVCYNEGEHFPEHCDSGSGLAKSLDRTVSFSAYLGEPGEHWTGGDLIVDGAKVEAHMGDLIGFTARTPHEVTPVESGDRFVLVALGEVAR